MAEEDKKSKEFHFGNSLKAVHPMYSDYERYFFLLIKADELSLKVQNLDFSSIREYFSTLKALYRNLNPLINPNSNIAKESFELLKKLDLQTFQLNLFLEQGQLSRESIPYSLFEDLEKLHSNLLIIKQFIGLGVMVQRDMSGKEKLDTALGI